MQVESLGRYRIEKELGRGAMGRVFLAYDPQIDRRVAIKTIQIFAALPEAERLSARERFLREARSAGKLLHPGIVTIFDVGEADGVPYLAMEFIEGATLESACTEGELLPVPDVVALVAAAADALGFAHARGIIHRDIKPANLMRVGPRGVKIMDFGLAKNPTTSMTHDGALLGTPNYMSPEQVRGEALDGRADLFSLGVVCYEMLTGIKPFGGDSVSSVLYRIVNEPPKVAALQLDRVPAPLAAFLARALAKNPGDRFPNAESFAAALRRAGESAAASTLPPAAKVAPLKPKRATAAPRNQRPRAAGSLGRWVLGIVLVAGIAGLSAVWFLAHTPPAPAALLAARVRTEPAGLPVALNGTPLADDVVRFSGDGPFGVLTVASGCRETKHRIEPADAGRELVLVLDPARAEVAVDPGVPGAQVAVNGQALGAAPQTVDLDLCRDNTIAVSAEGFRTASMTIPEKATPLDARTAAGAIRLEPIPIGRIVLPVTRVPVAFFIDGKPAARTNGGVEIPAGSHEVRATNEDRFVDVTTTLEVPEGGSVTPQLAVPALARLIVQTFPPNCRVALKRAGAAWRPAGETPLRYELAAGRYAMKIDEPISGESREQEINLAPGVNAPVRVSFGRSRR